MEYHGEYNWQGEVHKLWTTARNPLAAHKNFINQLVIKLGFLKSRLNTHFNNGKANHKIWEGK